MREEVLSVVWTVAVSILGVFVTAGVACLAR